MENKYFFVSDTIPKTGVIYQQLYPDTDADIWDEPSNGRIIYPDGTIRYFSAPYQYGKDNLPIPSKGSKAQDAFWEILLGPNVIDYGKKGDLDKVRKERKNNKKFANGGKPSRLHPKKFKPGGDIEDEINELPPYYNGTDTVPSTNITRNNKYGKSADEIIKDINELQWILNPIRKLRSPNVRMNDDIRKRLRKFPKPTALKYGGVALKVDRGNGIEGYRSVSKNDVTWIRSADGRYIPQPKAYMMGGALKFDHGGNTKKVKRDDLIFKLQNDGYEWSDGNKGTNMLIKSITYGGHTITHCVDVSPRHCGLDSYEIEPENNTDVLRVTRISKANNKEQYDTIQKYFNALNKEQSLKVSFSDGGDFDFKSLINPLKNSITAGFEAYHDARAKQSREAAQMQLERAQKNADDLLKKAKYEDDFASKLGQENNNNDISNIVSAIASQLAKGGNLFNK